ncbi:hypothetical protein KUM39_04555 [Streptomyces sp. J2-1]|uniref:SCO2583/SCO2584 N-terminal domain-containing protein n=1 Tax=Streptomyces corallincola TaxID=2851888 RepID=UPI001C39085D|nr:hypothetical protein [Streptomyces corallincola]MBV2353637.1 hypothetical protein [Streptomyces corallincola]
MSEQTEKSEQDDWEREFDLRWAKSAPYKEPSARARMLAARWRDNPPDPAPFRAAPDHRPPRRSSWLSTALVLGSILALIALLGYARSLGWY